MEKRIEAAGLRSATTRNLRKTRRRVRTCSQLLAVWKTPFSTEFEDRVSMLRREKEERQRLSSISRKRLDELEADLSRVEEARLKRHQERDGARESKSTSQESQGKISRFWRSGKIDSDRVKHFCSVYNMFRVSHPK